MFDRDSVFKFFGNGKEEKGDEFKLYYAYDLITTALEAKFGDKAAWLPEYQEIVDWLHDNKGDGLLVIGDSGRGKSVICRDIIPAVLNDRFWISSFSPYCYVTTAYRMASKGFENDDFPYGSKAIMIDDVGTEGDFVQFGARRNLFKEVVDWAEEHHKLLILTSNLTIEKLQEKYDERTVDRLKSLCRLVITKGNSLRTNIGSGIPKRIRECGIDFDTQEEANTFADEQRAILNRINQDGVEVFSGDREEYEEGQPMKIVYNPDTKNDMAYALFKHDWNKYEEYLREKGENIPF